MRSLRALARVVAIVLASVTLFVVYLAGLALLFFSRRLRLQWRNVMVRRWARALSAIGGLHSTVLGVPPPSPSLLVTNHASDLDVLLLSSVVDVAFVAKAEMRRWPLVGLLASSTGTIFVDRTTRRDAIRVTAAIEATFRRGLSVTLFPEGTASDGSSVLPFKSALLDVAARNAIPVHFGAIRYRQRVAAWGDDSSFAAHAWRLLGEPSIDATLRFGGNVEAADRKELAQLLHEEVAVLHRGLDPDGPR